MTNQAVAADVARGLVIAKSTGQYTVRTPDGDVVCRVSNKLRKELVYPIAEPASVRRRVVAVQDIRAVDPIAVGDEMEFLPAGRGAGQIVDVAERRSKLSRRAPGPKPLEQVIVANVDRAMPVVAVAQPGLKWSLLDRYLVDCEAVDLPAVVCLAKVDLIDPATIADGVRDLERAGYRVLLTSAVTGAGLDELRECLAGGLRCWWASRASARPAC